MGKKIDIREKAVTALTEAVIEDDYLSSRVMKVGNKNALKGLVKRHFKFNEDQLEELAVDIEEGVFHA